ncbi:MAG: signal recognition particle-docking protein FtsY [Aigarchaeota archaeon]|nr:signal recognition particle-docking protein FtsY [Candidatus Wolframiiraptor gerlachensis]
MLDGIRRALESVAEALKTRRLSEEEVREHVEEFKLMLISNDVAVEVAERLGEELAERLRLIRVRRFGDGEGEVMELVAGVLDSVIREGSLDDLLRRIREKASMGEPFVILFVGPNGGGKTTTVVKLARLLQRHGFKCLIAASDTFRAGAIEQLQRLASEAGVRVVCQRYGADPAAVAMDTVMSARANRIPVVLIDTAGRTEVDHNLLEEMRKIKRVVGPDLVIYVGDALAGNAAVEQARRFDEYVGVDYIILAKLDADARGGSAISISYVTGKPVLFVGTGQGLDDLEPFTKDLLKRLILGRR